MFPENFVAFALQCPVKNYDNFVKAGWWNLYINAGNGDKTEKTPIMWDATETNLCVRERTRGGKRYKIVIFAYVRTYGPFLGCEQNLSEQTHEWRGEDFDLKTG